MVGVPLALLILVDTVMVVAAPAVAVDVVVFVVFIIVGVVTACGATLVATAYTLLAGVVVFVSVASTSTTPAQL